MAGVEQNFVIRCRDCRWAKMTTGLSTDLADLHEITSCASCGGKRDFQCPKCGGKARLIRVKGNT